MPSQATSTTTVLIIPLILNTLFAPAPQTWAPMANAPEIVYQIADQPHHNHSSQDPSAGHPSWIPPVDICRVHFGIANTSDSSVLLLLLVSLPNQQGQPVRSQYGINTTKVNMSNSTAPWTSLPLEPGIYGVPNKASEEHSISNPFGLNISLDVGSFSLSNSTLLPMSPMIEIQDREISDHPVVGAPALFGLVLCSSDGKDSFIPSIFQDGRRYTREVLPRYRKRRTSAAQPRKLLSADNRTNLHNNQHLLVSKKNIVIVTAAAIAICSALLALLICCTAGLRMRMSSEDEMPIQQADLCPSGPRRYTHHELVAAANGFAEERKIGRGGFGPVYRGFMADQGRHVAIKVMSEGSSAQAQGIREFQAEVKVMTRLRHRNIVQLLGWCDGQGGLMLVYEFVPDGSLDKHLYDSQRILAWSDRYKIALGLGSAILYLHTECEQCVLHGDIKPANILLDHSCNAKLGDFGLARLVDHGTDLCTTQVVAGTPGYMDPEFVNSQRPCIESDIFSFGIVLLEIACGRRPTTRTNGAPVLLNWVRDMYNKNSILGVADRRLDGELDQQQMRRVLVAGLWCTHHEQSQRPSISQAMDLLRREDADLPVLDPLMHNPDAVRSLEEIAYGDLSAEDSVLENSSTDTTAYHTSTDSSRLLE